MSNIVGIDVDGTINNLCDCVLKVYNSDSGDTLQVSNITQYYIENFVKPEYRENFHKYFLDKRVWKLVKINPLAQMYISLLNKTGYEIYFVTSTEVENLSKKSRWLERNFPELAGQNRIILCHKKQLLSGLDILIDDYQENLIGGKYKKILLSYPWNRSIECAKYDIQRAEDWNDVYTIIKSGELI